ncbi:MAG: dihydroorotate dehydrogenase electron transfer subunit [Oscillospiraceae bacterium]|nr:dihydroorotate dehydrogenase electron transfer subunit [Oscillospiraceae bacterium]
MTVTVLSNENPRPGAADLRVRVDASAQRPRAGQFAHIACGDALLLRRPISLCDCDEEAGVWRFVFEYKGPGTRYLAARKPGDTLDLLGPLGRGFTCEPEGPPTLLAGGGIGVPPLLLAARRLTGAAHAVLGFRAAPLAVLTDELASLCARTAFCSDDGSLGTREFTDAVVRRLLAETAYARVLACGPRPMLRAVAEAARAAGVPCEVSLEERMACGVGACLACACRVGREAGETFRRVCLDGPVFDAETVVW